MTYTDDTAVKALKGDEKEADKAYTWIYNNYSQRLCYYASKLVASIEIAEDIVHNVFLKLWKNREKINITGSLSSYLHASVRNGCLSHLAQIKVVHNHIEYTLFMADDSNWLQTHDNDNPLTKLIWQEIADEIGKAIETLPVRCKEVFLLWEEGFTYEEIVKELGIDIGTVHTQIKRAKAKLRESLEDIFE